MNDYLDFDESEFEAELLKTSKPNPDHATVTCLECGGSGVFRSYRLYPAKGSEVGPCYGCRGTGKTTGLRVKRRQAGKKAQLTRKQNQAKWMLENVLIIKWMRDNSHWCDFASQILSIVDEGRKPSEKQMEAIVRIKTKTEATRAAKKSQREAASSVSVDLSKVFDLFSTAQNNGLKRPKLYFEDFILSLAPESGRNAGYLYVKQNNDYLGKVSPDGNFVAVRGLEGQSIVDQLSAVVENPLEALAVVGKKTGRCGCCGRELTNSDSIKAGIGPICAGRWGL